LWSLKPIGSDGVAEQNHNKTPVRLAISKMEAADGGGAILLICVSFKE